MAPMEFVLEEATIDDLHAAICQGRITCTQVVQRYIERCQRYNGVATVLVTADGTPVSNGLTGSIRAHNPLAFPPQTIPVSEVLPDFHHYQGPPLDLGHMDTTASDPQVHQQMGMVRGIPQSGQLNALSTLNIRGERSVTCKGEFDRHPSLGPLPPGAPPACDIFRHYPDALEQAAAAVAVRAEVGLHHQQRGVVNALHRHGAGVQWPAHAALTVVLPSASVVMVTVGALPPLGAMVSSLALSLPGALWLLATSLTVAVTVNLVPSAGWVKVVVT